MFFLAERDSKLDIVFVLGARNPRGSLDYDAMKKITQKILDQPRPDSTRYGFVTYDDSAQTRQTLDVPKQILKQLLDIIPWLGEGTRLDKGIEMGIKLFNQPSRPDAEKVLVAFTNDKTSSTNEALGELRRKADEAGIKVIVIAMGSRVDPAQIRRLVPNNENVILVDVIGDDDEIRRKVKETADTITEASKEGLSPD